MAESTKRLLNAARQIIKTTNDQLTEPFHLETDPAHSFWGLCARLYSKLTAHTLCISINRLLGKPNFLQIKSLAFPIQHFALISLGWVRSLTYDQNVRV